MFRCRPLRGCIVGIVCLAAGTGHAGASWAAQKSPIALTLPLPAKAASVTVPLIVEGNAPIIELAFPLPSGKLRKARFLVDTGGGALLLGKKLMADISAK